MGRLATTIGCDSLEPRSKRIPPRLRSGISASVTSWTRAARCRFATREAPPHRSGGPFQAQIVGARSKRRYGGAHDRPLRSRILTPEGEPQRTFTLDRAQLPPAKPE